MQSIIKIIAISLIIVCAFFILSGSTYLVAKSRTISKTSSAKSKAKSASSGISIEKEYAKALNLLEGKEYLQAIKILDLLITKSKSSEAKGRYFYLRAYCYNQLEDWRKAISDYQSALKQSQFQFNDLAKYHIANSYKSLNENKAAIGWYETVIRDHPGTLLAMDALYQAGELCYRTKKYESAITYYAKFSISYPEGIRARTAIYKIGLAYQELKKWPEAYVQFQKVIRQDMKDSVAVAAVDKLRILTAIHTEIPVTREARILNGMTLLYADRYNDARVEFKKAMAGVDDLSAEAAYYIADSYYGEGKYDVAIKEYNAVAKFYPKSIYAAKSQYQVALCYLKKRKEKEFKSLVSKFLVNYPDNELSDDIEFKFAEYYYNKGKYKEASNEYSKVIDKYPNSDLIADALWNMGWCYMKLKDNQMVLKAFKRLAIDYPQNSRAGEARFWGAIAAEKSGNWRDAFDLYKESMKYGDQYYSVRARKRAEGLIKSGKVEDDISSIQSEMYSRIKIDDSVPAWKEVHNSTFERTKELLAMRLFDDAIKPFLAAIEASVNMEDAYYNLAICYARIGEYNTSWAYAYKLSQLPGMKRADGAMPRQVYQLLYPLAYRETILKNSEANNLDPFLVSAVIHQESKYDYNACSRVGALGLMQIMPLTGDEIADRLGITDYNTDMLCSAEINIKMGTWYLSNLISKFNQLVRSTLSSKKQSGLEPDYREIAKILALGAYNGGEGRVRRWMENYGIDNIDEFVENAINLRETKDYVKKVCDAYEAYKLLYGEEFDVRS